jgi:drug/metabolite transporter (DMT)-like permease
MPRGSVRGSGAPRGVLLYLGALALFASMDACTKHLVGGLPVIEVMWARFSFHLLTVAIALRLVGQRLPWRPRAPRLQCLRSLALASCTLLFVAALARIPLAEATAVNFAGPLFTVLLAVLWLHERVGWQKWAGVAAGLAGVLIILRPFGTAFHPVALLALGSAAINAFYLVLTRRLAAADTPQTTIFHTGLWAALAASLVVPFVWVTPNAGAWAGLIAIGVLGGLSHFLLVLAYQRAPASLLALFGELPDAAMVLGAAVIIGGGLLALSGEPGARPASRLELAPRRRLD